MIYLLAVIGIPQLILSIIIVLALIIFILYFIFKSGVNKGKSNALQDINRKDVDNKNQ